MGPVETLCGTSDASSSPLIPAARSSAVTSSAFFPFISAYASRVTDEMSSHDTTDPQPDQITQSRRDLGARLRLREEVGEQDLVVRAERIVRRGGREEVRRDQLGALCAEIARRSRRDRAEVTPR